MDLSKNTILMIIAGVGALMSLILGLLGNGTASIVIFILTLFVFGLVFMLYQVPDGEACTPDKADSNVATWVMDTGLCQPSSCVSDQQFIMGKKGSLIKTCATPTDLPDKWTDAKSNTFTNTSNLISTAFKTDTEYICGYSCLDEPKCVIAGYDSSTTLCSLYKHDDRNSTTDMGPPIQFITRPNK